jgi:DNA-binding MarR family transcriptional regulator
MDIAAKTPPAARSLEFPSAEPYVTWGYFLKAYKNVVEAIDRYMQSEAPVSLAEFEIMLHVRDAYGRIRFIDLAKIMALSQSRISRQIDALHSKGYIFREVTDSDRRATFAVLTNLGETAYQKALPAFLESFEENFSRLIPAKHMPVFRQCLKALLQDDSFTDSVAAIMAKTRSQNSKNARGKVFAKTSKSARHHPGKRRQKAAAES